MKFVIAFTPRSGSTHLCQLLGSHYAVACWGEILNKRHKGLYRKRGPYGVLYDLFFQCHNPILAAGGKVAFGHSLQREFQAEPWEMMVNDREIRIIHLRRRNILKQALSQERNSQSKAWSQEDKQRADTHGLHFDPDRAIARMERIEKHGAELDRCFAGHVSVGVEYEQLDENPDGVCRDLLQFLELDDLPLRSNRKKLNTRPLSQSISNFDSLVSCLRGTRWEQYLES